MNSTAIALFAKAPRPGKVKTRLIPSLTPPRAAEFHRLCAIEAWRRARSASRADLFFYCDVAWEEFEQLAGAGRFRLQRGRDLGQKMFHCLDELLAGGYRKALIVGGDSPTLPPEYPAQALQALDQADAVLGPCEDGGYYLLGARRARPNMFDDVEWSAPWTRRQTARAFERMGWRTVEIDPWYDVDLPADLDRLRTDPALPESLQGFFTEAPER